VRKVQLEGREDRGVGRSVSQLPPAVDFIRSWSSSRPTSILIVEVLTCQCYGVTKAVESHGKAEMKAGSNTVV
jgi:hypothetical protein